MMLMEANVAPTPAGSRLEADHPENGGLIPRLFTTMVTGTPVFDAVPAALDCDVEEMLPRYDHAILIGKVRAVRLSAGTAPLAYWRGDYHPLSPGDDRTN
jgi:flavin reductase (DIM6/NTAB) family NADH-FMN oxidoreductase RutF